MFRAYYSGSPMIPNPHETNPASLDVDADAVFDFPTVPARFASTYPHVSTRYYVHLFAFHFQLKALESLVADRKSEDCTLFFLCSLSISCAWYCKIKLIVIHVLQSTNIPHYNGLQSEGLGPLNPTGFRV